MLNNYALKTPEILLPDLSVDLTRWAVVACDQFTSQPEYWARVKALVGDKPSTLNIVYPEAWLGEGDGRIAAINAAMADYLKNVLARRVHGCVLVERTIAAGKRLGLIAALDLEQYDFAKGSNSLVRATEGTILERIPPRVRIREHAPLETPHVMVLVDDPERTLIEPVYARRDSLEKLYDFELMEGGGHIRGWLADESGLESALAGLNDRADGLLYAVGDGNHSLATAKTCWENLKKTLSSAEIEMHPARWALVELNNLYDPALVFEPIHRALFGVTAEAFKEAFSAWLRARGMALETAAPEKAMFTLVGDPDEGYAMRGLNNPLPLYTLQMFLDEWLKTVRGASIDYIHGADAVRELSAKGAVGLLLPAMDKRVLFESVRRGGALPRKTFSMGEASEKRYYLECRRISAE